MERAVFTNCNFEDPSGLRSNLEGCNLKGANFENSNASNVNLRVANLKGANLKNCILRSAILAGLLNVLKTPNKISQTISQIRS
jgi:BTB/POZ domain-containing protein KCTD9